eukprot:scaffold87641_cov48-Phaeocystis_antarctica.AAC.1
MAGHGARERVDQGVAALLIHYLLLPAYYFTANYLAHVSGARERVDQGVATGPHHIVRVEGEPARHLGVITREHGPAYCTHYMTREHGAVASAHC